jgi:hypothetical protein
MAKEKRNPWGWNDEHETPLVAQKADDFDPSNVAWRKYHDAHCADWTPRDAARARSGFLAGWAACKATPKIVVPPPVESLFPTNKELGE